MKLRVLQQVGLVLLLAMLAGVSNASIIRTYDETDGSGLLTYTDIGNNQLKIEFDNTSANTLSSVITGLVFDVDDDINSVSAYSFTDGNGFDLTSLYDVVLDAKSNIVKGNAKLDVLFQPTSGIDGGIYNAAGNSNFFNTSMFPDIATLILTIDGPTTWALNDISNDFLRLQQTGLDNEGSLKVAGDLVVVPLPAAFWLLGSGLLGLVGIARRRS